ncbi:MAG TPA: farnesyl diphosphate synthase [Xanthobacteraceae bacterium]|nr:farnesyl diphosphate synthase [Xanthobacteraceae bacterium]
MSESPMIGQLPEALTAAAIAVEAYLDRAIGDDPAAARPPRLVAAMRHAALGGGKRVRPFLVVQTAALFGLPMEAALPAAAALECVHCYSLVHDDLPAMDDDDLRRGRPTVHRAFDEATAILAGDALLTLAFELLARPQAHADPAVRIALVAGLARASGADGMVGGQMLDLAAEGRFAAGATALDAAAIARLQAMKTGALLAFGCEAGATLGRAAPAEHTALAAYAAALGRAFQIADDLLDVEGEAGAVGKAVGKDAAAGKATFVGLLGIAGARAELARLVGEAEAALAGFGTRAANLSALAHFIATRRN